jgi:hypothetical protein
MFTGEIPMRMHYQARWVSKPRADAIRKSVHMAGAMLLDSFNGIIIVEPLGAKLGDGPMMSSQQADYEIQMVWCRESPAKIHEARKLLGLEAGTRAGSLAG